MTKQADTNGGEIRRTQGVRTPVVVALVAALHVGALGAFLFIQGCVTRTVSTPPERATLPPPPEPETPPRPEPPEFTLPPRTTAPRPTPAPAPLMPTPEPGPTYTVQAGDSLSRIAQRHGVTADEIAQLNQITNRNMIRVGQKLVLPEHARARTPAPTPAPTPALDAPAAPDDAPAGTTVVRPGDTLTHIARRHGTTVAALREANNLTSDLIRVGQTLKLPGAADAPEPRATPRPAEPRPDAPEVTPPPDPIPPVGIEGIDHAPSTYRVKDGETLDDIARKFIVSKQELMRVNNLAEGQALQAGQTILIPWNTLP